MTKEHTQKLREEILLELANITGDTPDDVKERAMEYLNTLHQHLHRHGVDTGIIEWTWNEVVQMQQLADHAITVAAAARATYEVVREQLDLTQHVLNDQFKLNSSLLCELNEVRQDTISALVDDGIYISPDPAMDLHIGFVDANGTPLLSLSRCDRLTKIINSPRDQLQQEDIEKLANVLNNFLDQIEKQTEKKTA